MDFQQLLASHLTPSQIIIDIMVVCMLVGAVDYFRGNKWGIGERFFEGFSSFGSLAITMTGIIVFIPLIEKYAASFITPLCLSVGIDPAMLVGSFIASDMGGYQLAVGVAGTPEAGALGGMILGCMMGANIVFNIPVSLGILEKSDRPFMAKGVLCGFITIPLGCFAGGLCAGIPLAETLVLLIPVMIFSAVICLLLWLAPNGIIRAFIIFGRLISCLALVGTVVSIFTELTKITVIPGLGSVYDGMDIVMSIVLVLPGAYVLVALVSKLLKKPFEKAGAALGVNDKSTLGLVSTIANAVPTFMLVRDMDERGKIINYAFIVGAGYLLGDHLAFCSALDKTLVLPLLVGKIVAGVSAAAVAVFMTRGMSVKRTRA